MCILAHALNMLNVHTCRKVLSYYVSPGENFCQFRHLLSEQKKELYSVIKIFANDYKEDMATFTALAKILQYKGSWAW